ncbi:MAG: signal peptidase I [Mediterranea sp.]|jgi:signal peptidase I|nr:signal peptidase I [Mediterranea sp.]
MKWGKRIIVFAGAIVAVLLLRSFIFTPYSIPSSGMENSLYQGDRIIVNKWSYGLRLPCLSLFAYRRWNSQSVKPGDIVVFNNPADLSQPIIDKREVFISRCIAAPGEELVLDSLYNPTVFIEKAGPDRKRLYTYPKNMEQTMVSLLNALELTKNELMGQNEQENVRSFSRYEMYLLEQAATDISWIRPQSGAPEENFRTIVVPAKGKSIKIHPWNATLYRNTLVLHEGIKADVKNDSLYINGEAIIACTFTKDYYWMASNNSINLADSRLFGFVPHDHIIGKASFIWFSKEVSTDLFNGYRLERFFCPVR